MKCSMFKRLLTYITHWFVFLDRALESYWTLNPFRWRRADCETAQNFFRFQWYLPFYIITLYMLLHVLDGLPYTKECFKDIFFKVKVLICCVNKACGQCKRIWVNVEIVQTAQCLLILFVVFNYFVHTWSHDNTWSVYRRMDGWDWVG